MEATEAVEPAQNTPAPTPDPGVEPSARSAPRRRRTGRTIALIAVAAVIGLVGGTAVGYGVQAQREPVALAPLNQPGLVYPAKSLPKDQEPAPLAASQDRQAKAQGDLRKLLLPRPEGAKARDWDGWVPLYEYAQDYGLPGSALQFQLEQGIRRVAARSWETGDRVVTVELVQFRPGSEIGALAFVEDQQDFAARDDEAGYDGDAVKGSTNGRTYVYPVHREAGYLDLYEARAYVQRGDIAVAVAIFDTRKIAKKDIRSLAERQLGRL
ncbi:hypothetical protein [Streptomyces sp. NRRL F-5727]|uniref:hypothetical protein n=1 Tax=Streptomyces sp. NRRL F-5727 TaxID=1463871 RepID=UPI00068D8CAA|nr:hypothetical protein [Streptomyces sp. NRRL F-5727]